MSKRIKILWIEEETTTANANRLSFLQTSWGYEITVVETFKEGKEKLKRYEYFEVIIIDIRIPSGDEESVEDLTFDAYQTRLGLRLIQELFDQGKNAIEKLLIYTNEAWEDIQTELGDMAENVKPKFLHKNDCRTNQDFEALILKIYNRGRTV